MIHKIAGTLMALTFVLANPVMGAEVSCQYDTNSEWPWLDSRVCQSEDRPAIFNDEGSPICSDARADKDGDGWGWENGHSCVIDLTQPDNRGSDVPGQVVEQEDLVVFEQDFETASVGTYLPEVLNEQWDTPIWHLGLNEGRVQVVQDAVKGKAMQVLFPANQYGSAGAAAFLNDLSFGVDFKRNFEELYVSYDVKFAEDFDFVRGGKLPGLCGYNVTQDPKDGCNTGGGFPTGYDGWSGRGMWREDGILENYMYHADQFYEYGDDETWSAKAERGKWHSFQHRIVLNTVGEANGIVEAWFDGVKVLSSNNMLYRKTADIGINLFYFSTFYGGADPSWAPSSDQYIYFDNFRIATTPLGTAESDVAEQASMSGIQSVETNNLQQVARSAVGDNLQESELSVESDSLPEIELSVESDSLPETGLSVESDSLPETGLSVESDSVQESGLSAESNSLQEPDIAAANELAAGGGVFFPWWLGLAFIIRRKSASEGFNRSITFKCYPI